MGTKTPSMRLVKPAITDKVQQTIADLASNFDWIDRMWPVGSIYMSASATNPSTFLGGTWARVEGRFLVGAGTDFAAGTTGGQRTMGVHRCGEEVAGYGLTQTGGYKDRVVVAGEDYSGKLLPPYLSVYIWKRTA